jgi:hypothetical protein
MREPIEAKRDTNGQPKRPHTAPVRPFLGSYAIARQERARQTEQASRTLQKVSPDAEREAQRRVYTEWPQLGF